MLELLPIVLVLGAVVWFVFELLGGWRWQVVQTEQAMEGSPSDAKVAWQAQYTGPIAQNGYQPTGQTETTLTYTRTYIPGFAIALAVCLFPIGLLALVARRDAVLSIAFRPSGEHSVAVISGTAQRELALVIDRLGEQPLVASRA